MCSCICKQFFRFTDSFFSRVRHIHCILGNLNANCSGVNSSSNETNFYHSIWSKLHLALHLRSAIWSSCDLIPVYRPLVGCWCCNGPLSKKSLISESHFKWHVSISGKTDQNAFHESTLNPFLLCGKSKEWFLGLTSWFPHPLSFDTHVAAMVSFQHRFSQVWTLWTAAGSASRVMPLGPIGEKWN